MPILAQGHKAIIPKKETPGTDFKSLNNKWEYRMRKKDIPALGGGLLWKACDKLAVSARALTSADKFDNLNGDTYDYRMVIILQSQGVNQVLKYLFNNDTGANYRNYRSRGHGTTANAYIDDAATFLSSNTAVGTDTNYATMSVTEISGDSNMERSVCSKDASTWDTTKYINVFNDMWKNKVDELTSINFKDDGNGNNYTFDAYLFRRKKDSSATDGYEQVDQVEFSGRDLSGSPIEFSGLTGDTDKEYILEVEMEGATSATSFAVRFNNDSTTGNYTYESLKNTAGTLTAITGTAVSWLADTNVSDTAKSKLHIQAESGRKRVVLINTAGTDGQMQWNYQSVWSNTADEITSIKIVADNTNLQTGKATLYKRASTESQLISREDIDGDFSAGKTWSGLTGDTDGIYEIIANTVDKGAVAGLLGVQINGDAGSNYEYQYVRGHGTTVDAATATDTIIYGGVHYGTIPELMRIIIFPVSGKYRPIITERTHYNGTDYSVIFTAVWWKNTSSEITSLKIFNSVTTAIKGYVQLKKITLPN